MNMTVWFFLLLLVAASVAHVCLQDEIFDLEAVMDMSQDYSGSYPFANNTEAIRLRIDSSYLDNDLLGMTCTSTGATVPALPSSSSTTTFSYTCKSQDVMTSTMRGYLENLLTKAQDLFEATLRVMPVLNNLSLSGTTATVQGLYGGVYLTQDYLSGVPAMDMVIFVTARPIVTAAGETTSTLAVARVVQQDQYGRPIFGHLNINLAGIDTSAASYARNFGVVIHEMSHSLGFTYQKFQDINPVPGSSDTDITATVSLNVGANDAATSRTIVNSPRVVAWAQAYFGCSSLQGVELENQGGSGTALSHWEKRLVLNEYMTGTASRNPVFSDLTLALFEDSGWYVVNYSRSAQLLWGQGLGCDFAKRSCMNWPSYQGYFCSENDKKGCTADYQAKGVCLTGSYTTLDPLYRYFSDPNKGGFVELPDYCPITWGYENGWCFDTTSPSSVIDKGEVFGDSSRCYQSSLVKGFPVGGSTDQTCYPTYCTGPAEMRVRIGGYYYECPPGSEIRVIGYGGTVKCPDKISQICANSINDDTWPVFLTISPNAGGPGLRVNITGRNFLSGTKVSIGDDDPLEDVVVVSSSVISGRIPTTSFDNPTTLIDQPKSVIITDTKGRSTVGYNKFTVKVSLDKEFFKRVIAWMKERWLITAAIIGGLVVTCFVCGYCCYRQKGKAEEADTDYYD